MDKKGGWGLIRESEFMGSLYLFIVFIVLPKFLDAFIISHFLLCQFHLFKWWLPIKYYPPAREFLFVFIHVMFHSYHRLGSVIWIYCTILIGIVQIYDFDYDCKIDLTANINDFAVNAGLYFGCSKLKNLYSTDTIR